MAFFRSVGRALQIVSQSPMQERTAAGVLSPAALLLSRYMSGSQLFIGGLAWGADEQSLVDAFSPYGDIQEAKIIRDKFTGRSRGFGFVSFNTDEEAQTAMADMNGKEIAGRSVRVDYASRRQTAPGAPGGGAPGGGRTFGNRGSYGGSGGGGGGYGEGY